MLFDSLILLDTVRVVLGGGLKANTRQRYTTGIDFDLELSDAEPQADGIEPDTTNSPEIRGLAEA